MDAGSRESAADLLVRLKLGREEFVQRLFTQLILGGPYPRWNSRSQPSARGAAFLKALDELSFGRAHDITGAEFVDELELRGRNDEERGGAPDWAVVWPQRLWVIELKTEVASHRPGQIPLYYDLGAHHFPQRPVDLTYLTPLMTTPTVALANGCRFAHLTWSQALDVAASVWAASPDPWERELLRFGGDVLSDLGSSWPAWRAARLDLSLATTSAAAVDPLDLVLTLATLTAEDGLQRALDVTFGSLEELEEVRVESNQRLRAFPDGDPRRRVRPWLWRAASTDGRPLTASGEETGYELRVSRYERPL